MTMTAWTWLIPAFSFALLLGGLAADIGLLLSIVCAAALIGAVIAAVHHAEVVAHRVGEPFGTLILAVAVTIIEVALILSIMLAGGLDAAALPRDTIYAAIMIIGIETGETKQILSASSAQRIVQFSGIPWTPDGRSVLVRKVLNGNQRESTSELWLVPIADAPPRKLDIDVNSWAAGNRGVISLSSDGRQIAFRSGQGNAEVWVLENFLPALSAKK